MLFNSPIFIFIFLPIVLAGFFGIARMLGREAAIIWLVVASLGFYGWWNPAYLILISLSIVVNFSFGFLLPRMTPGINKKLLLTLGIVFNLGLLGYFKYANFFVDSVNALVGTSAELAPIVLPLAISFFTFQQVAYLVDAYKDATHEYNFSHYCLFVVFFPQLIAGPIVHHKEMLPQFSDKAFHPQVANFAAGLSIFFLGLGKKVILADSLALYSSPVFAAADAGIDVTFVQAWVGSLAYTFQLYFDFSGYSDMAIGLARLFGIKLPLNFNSPYKATSIIDLWKRWHMTLSRFLRDYVYIPLGGSRRGNARRYTNLLLTMLIGGLWHGAGWTFVVWGALHGIYLVINHAWRRVYALLGYPFGRAKFYTRLVSGALTFFAVVVAWVVFRAETIGGAKTMLLAMSGRDGVALPTQWMSMAGGAQDLLSSLGVTSADAAAVSGGSRALIWVAVGAFVVFLMPNVQEIMQRCGPVLESYSGQVKPARIAWLRWKPNAAWAVVVGVVATSVFVSLANVSEFLYFQF